jgi:hypothetical protein
LFLGTWACSTRRQLPGPSRPMDALLRFRLVRRVLRERLKVVVVRRGSPTISAVHGVHAWLGVGAALGVGCSSVHAADGRVFSSGDEAVRASAAHDLGCGPALVTVTDVGNDENAESVAEGCGWRATYRYKNVPYVHFGDESVLVQVSRFPIHPPDDVGAGCSKDTDCKGERVCVQRQCVEPTQKH